jgi:hypothetical protein
MSDYPAPRSGADVSWLDRLRSADRELAVRLAGWTDFSWRLSIVSSVLGLLAIALTAAGPDPTPEELWRGLQVGLLVLVGTNALVFLAQLIATRVGPPNRGSVRNRRFRCHRCTVRRPRVGRHHGGGLGLRSAALGVASCRRGSGRLVDDHDGTWALRTSAGGNRTSRARATRAIGAGGGAIQRCLQP